MPRSARIKSRTGIYHIVLRGINRQKIFLDDEDRLRLYKTLHKYKEKCQYSIYAYCFMDNHIHLLLKEGGESLDQVMRRIGASFVYWYNHKYDRIGNLFQDRYKSEAVEDDTYFLTALRYIHQNPIKAGIVKGLEGFSWSSYMEYLEEEDLIDKEYVLRLFNNNIKEFVTFNNEINKDNCLDIKEKERKISDEDIKTLIDKRYRINNVSLIHQPKEIQEGILRELLGIQGISTRQLSRVTGVPVNTIWKL